MKKYYLFILLSLCLVGSASAEYKAGYYDRMDGKSAAALKAAAKECVRAHQTLVYTDLPNYWQYSDVYPELVDGCKRWWDMYSDAVYLIRKGQSGTSSFSANKMQREHSVPKSWWKQNGSVEYTPAYSDMWNLYPSDGAANQAKLNYPLGLLATDTIFNNDVTLVGSAKTGYGGGSSRVFEPADEYKGDFARAYMYVATVYDDINWVINYMYRKEAYPTLVPWARDMLLQWCRMDPVDQKEIDRNNVVEQYQGNRNPFVDFPNLAEYIWGTRTTEIFYIKDQEGSDPTPPITGDPEISQPVTGEALDFGQVAVGRSETRVLQIVGKNLTSSLTVRVIGTDRALFAVEATSIPAATINQNQGYLLNITYSPTATGSHKAAVTLSDGGIEGSIKVDLQGEALDAPQMTALTALEPSDLTETSYTARWNAPSNGEIADYYVLTRTRLNGDNQETETYETGETSYTLTDRLPGVAETYYVQYSRLGILSPVSNEIYVAAGSSVEEVWQTAPVRVFPTEAGFVVRVPGEATPLHVYDVKGSEVMVVAAPEDGSEFNLPQGIYVVSAEGMRPVKVVVM